MAQVVSRKRGGVEGWERGEQGGSYLCSLPGWREKDAPGPLSFVHLSSLFPFSCSLRPLIKPLYLGHPVFHCPEGADLFSVEVTSPLVLLSLSLSSGSFHALCPVLMPCQHPFVIPFKTISLTLLCSRETACLSWFNVWFGESKWQNINASTLSVNWILWCIPSFIYPRFPWYGISASF